MSARKNRAHVRQAGRREPTAGGVTKTLDRHVLLAQDPTALHKPRGPPAHGIEDPMISGFVREDRNPVPRSLGARHARGGQSGYWARRGSLFGLPSRVWWSGLVVVNNRPGAAPTRDLPASSSVSNQNRAHSVDGNRQPTAPRSGHQPHRNGTA